MRTLQPKQRMIVLATTMFRDAWNQRLAQAKDALILLQSDAQKLDKQIEALLDRIVDAENPSIIAAYEKRLDKFERSKLNLAEKLENKATPALSFDELFELATRFLANPWKIWESG